MHYSFSNNSKSLKPGKKMIFNCSTTREVVLGTVLTNDYRDGFTVALKNGRHLKIHTANWDNTWKDQDGKSGYHIQWNNLIPNLPDEEIFTYVQKLSATNNRPILIHVDCVTNGKIQGRFITRTPDPNANTDVDIFDPREDDSNYDRVGYNDLDGVRTIDLPAVIQTYSRSTSKKIFETQRPVSEVFCNQKIEPGDLIISDNISMYYRNNELITVVNNSDSYSLNHGVNVLKKNASVDDIRAFLLLNVRSEDISSEQESVETDFGLLSSRHDNDMFMQVAEIENQVWQARLRQQPDEAIVLWLDDDSREGETHPFILGFTGHLFNTVDDLGDYIELDDVKEGLWLMKNPAFNGGYDYEGNYDCELNVDYFPATHEDLKRVLGQDFDINEDILDSLDGRDLEPDITDAAAYFIERARIANDDNQDNIKTLKP
jgi:hypothetical protein